MNQIEISPLFEQVLRFVNETNRPVFLTGKAGTGKTTLLKYIKENTFKQICVVAPTGVAAINAGGTTIHSFLQIPFGPFVPAITATGELDVARTRLPEMKYNSRRLQLFRSLELLVVDEVSMVRADLLDLMDLMLRRIRRSNQPFGGIQVLLIGDLYQLPPVARAEEWALMNGRYATPFFFDSFVIRQFPPVYVELEKIYRQNEQTFLEVLNAVRNNRMDARTLELLNARYQAHIPDEVYRAHVTLTTHNAKAEAINSRNLEALDTPVKKFKAEVEGSFPSTSYPAEEELILKVGARVMFLKNNTEKDYFNGKTGVVIDFEEDEIVVLCEGDQSPIHVVPEKWANTTYSINSNNEVREDILGTFEQYPLRLAWAITIHKSQGLTFDKVIIDAADSFSAGQVYVALSRCRTLEGLTLSSRIDTRALTNDASVVRFAGNSASAEKLSDAFVTARQGYIRGILLSLFDFTLLQKLREDLGGVVMVHRTKFNQDGLTWLNRYFHAIENLNQVSLKFKTQLVGLTENQPDPEQNADLQARLQKAAVYFISVCEEELKLFQQSLLRTDSKLAAEAFTPLLQDSVNTLNEKVSHFRVIAENGFTFSGYVRQRLKAKTPPFTVQVIETAKNVKVASDVRYPALYKSLLVLRDAICLEEELPNYHVATAKTLTELTNALPLTEKQLLKISGFGPARVSAFGERFLKIINDYVTENGITPELTLESEAPKKKKEKKEKKEKPTKPEKEPTASVTYRMYLSGKDVASIAKERALAATTIEGHLARYVASGEIPLEQLVSRENIKQINAVLDEGEVTSLAEVKAQLGDAVNWSDLKFVVASRKGASGE